MGTPNQPTATKTELIAVLDEVFRRRGYEGATLSELSRACGLGKASLYHHFPGGKDEMARVLLQRAVAELRTRAYRHLDRPAPWHERLIGFVEGFSDYCDGGARNCLVAELAATGARVKFADDIERQSGEWLRQLTAVFAETGASEKRARRRAIELLGSLYGALVIARLLNDPKPFRQTVRRLSQGFAKEKDTR
jgi:TetR/AcrR family transcriptional regulator, lmrAB and yxaGH operons repressor